MKEDIHRVAEALTRRFAGRVATRMPEVRERFSVVERMLGVPFTEADVGGYAFAESLGLETLVTEPPEPADEASLEGYRLASGRMGLRAVPALGSANALVLLPELARVILVGSEGGHGGEDLGLLAATFAIRFADEDTALRAREEAEFEAALARELWRRLRPEPN